MFANITQANTVCFLSPVEKENKLQFADMSLFHRALRQRQTIRMRFEVFTNMATKIHFLGCDAVQSGKYVSMFQRNLLPLKCCDIFTRKHGVTSYKTVGPKSTETLR